MTAVNPTRTGPSLRLLLLLLLLTALFFFHKRCVAIIVCDTLMLPHMRIVVELSVLVRFIVGLIS